MSDFFLPCAATQEQQNWPNKNCSYTLNIGIGEKLGIGICTSLYICIIGLIVAEFHF